MEINLSEEMIEKITCVAYGRVCELQRKLVEANKKEANTERKQMRKNILVKEISKALSDAEEVHQLFISMLNEIEEQ